MLCLLAAGYESPTYPNTHLWQIEQPPNILHMHQQLPRTGIQKHPCVLLCQLLRKLQRRNRLPQQQQVLR